MSRQLFAKAAVAALALAAVSVSACTAPPPRANAALCADFKAKTAPMPNGDGAMAVDDCARRWSYTLASAHDDANLVAEAVAGACSTQLSRWNQQSLAQPAAEGEAASILTGEPTTPIAEHNSFLRARALFYVVQSRAGKCAAPKVVNGAPEGLS